MADEINITAALLYDDGVKSDELIACNLLRDSGTTEVILHNTQSIGTTEEAVTVGDPGPGEARVRHHAVGLNFIVRSQR